jgi:hypothetical protein
MTTAAAIDHATMPSQLDVLMLRAWARALLWFEQIIETIPEAIDPLWEFAEQSGLVDELGADQVQRIIVDQFAPFRVHESEATHG